MQEITNNSKHGGYISKLFFNDETQVSLKENSIVLFVGPNNAGKTQSIKDIYELCEQKTTTTIVKDIKLIKYDDDINTFLKEVSTIKDHGNRKDYSGFNYNFNSISISNYKQNKYYGALRSIFVAFLDTSSRLSICDPAPLINRNDAKKYPIHYAAFDSCCRKWISNNFKKAFGKELIPNLLNGRNIPLCIGDPVKVDGTFDDEQDRQEHYADILDKYPQVQNQGDGIRSFTGILLYLMVNEFCTFLIDEPESFLHPPQANIMGRIIGESLKDNQQAFIATHSEEFMKGILDECPDRITIIRITRHENINSFSILENDKFQKIWNDPLLKYSNIMSSLFHNAVVLCESESDCKMYSIVENHLKNKSGNYSETLFIHCGGKQRMAKIVRALRSLNINIKLVIDLDVLNNENVFKDIVEAFDIKWIDVKHEYTILDANFRSENDSINRKDYRKKILEILDTSQEIELSVGELKTIRYMSRIKSKWENLKKFGVNAIPRGDAKESFNQINSKLEAAGIFMVPVGEIECFIKEIGDHGPKWVNRVLEKYNDLDADVYEEIRKFISKVCNIE